MQNNSIVLYDKISDPLVAVEKLGNLFYESGMYGCTTAEQGQMLAFICMAEKKSPGEILTHNHIVQGKLTRKADSLLAEFRSKGGKWKVLEWTKVRAAAHFIYLDNDMEMEYTIDDAREEGLLKSEQWSKRPRAMLWSKLITKMIKVMAPEIGTGTYTPEDVSTWEVEPKPEKKVLEVGKFQIDRHEQFVYLLDKYEPCVTQLFREKGIVGPEETYRQTSDDKILEFLTNEKKQNIILTKLAEMFSAHFNAQNPKP